MRLIFITDTLSSGGAERVVSILANQFAHKWSTEIVCLRKKEVFYEINPKVKILYADDYAKGWIGKMYWLRKYVKEEDVLLPFMVKVYCVTLLALIGKRVNVIASERNDPNTTKQPWKMLRPLLLPKVRTLVVQTQQIKDYFKDDIKKKIAIIVNPLDLKNCYLGEWNEQSKTVIAVGRTDPQKNYPMLIRAFSEIHKNHPDYRLEIWGNRLMGGGNLALLIEELGASDYISIHGRTDDMATLYGKAYMFVMSSDYEGLSNALIEALSSGLPVVATKVSGATDVIKSEENGLLVDIGDEQGLCRAMSLLIENADEAYRLSEKARQSRLIFAKEKICSQWETLINKSIEYEQKESRIHNDPL